MANKKLVKILSLDGGGIRGVIMAMVLTHIERQAGKPVSELFDLIAGTSAGGLLGLALATPDENGKPKYSAEKITDMYEYISKTVFTASYWSKIPLIGNLFGNKYTPLGGEKLVGEICGKVTLKEALCELLVPAFDIEMNQPFFFKRSDARKDPLLNFTLKEAGLATTSAPVYFKPFMIDKPKDPLVKHYAFIDGGVVANNPAMCAYVEAKTLWPDADEFLVVSLGTGDYIAKFLIENSRGWGAAQWIKPLLDILINGGGDVADHQLRTLLSTPGDKLNHYYRMQMRLHEDEIPFDDSREIKIHTMKLLAENYISSNKETIEKICKLLRE